MIRVGECQNDNLHFQKEIGGQIDGSSHEGRQIDKGAKLISCSPLEHHAAWAVCFAHLHPRDLCFAYQILPFINHDIIDVPSRCLLKILCIDFKTEVLIYFDTKLWGVYPKNGQVTNYPS